jgi:hypothetical protein
METVPENLASTRSLSIALHAVPGNAAKATQALGVLGH